MLTRLALLAAVSLPAIAQAQPMPQPNGLHPMVPAIIPNAQAEGTDKIVATPSTDTNAPTPSPGTSPAPAPGTTLPADQVPNYMPPTPRILSPNQSLRPVEKKAVVSASRWMGRASAPAMGPDGRMHFSGSVTEPFIVCAPLHVCDIALQPGEMVNLPFQNGDPRWIIHPGISGEGMTRVTHLILKPTDAGLNSNLIVMTNKRVISLRLVSQEGRYMPLIALDGDESTSESWNAYAATMGTSGGGFGDVCDQAPSVPPSGFKIERSRVSWRPVQTYAVSTPNGPKTCIEFPASIGSADLPALLLLGKNTGWFGLGGPSEQIVNYRFTKNRFVLDRLVDKAVLVAGVGRNQDRVEIERVGQ